MSCLGLLPAFQQECDFRLSTDQRCESSWLSNIETPPGSTFLEDAVHVDGRSHTSERLCSQVLTREIALDQSIGGFTDSHRIRRCQSFNARSNVGHFSQGQLFLTPCSTHGTDHHQPSMDAHAESKLDAFGLLQTLIQVSHRSEDIQARAYCFVGIVFMCLGIAKVDQETIPKELGDMSIKACDHF